MRNKFFAAIAVVSVLALLLSACAQPTPEVVEVEKEVTKVVEATKIVEKEVEVEVEKEVVVTATPPPPEPKELRIGISTEPWDLDPAMRTDTGSGYIIDSVYNALIELDENRQPTTEFALMTDWEWNDDSTVLTLYLREGVKFHDGTDFDAADVKYNIDWMLDPENECPNAGTLGPVESTEVIDDHTLQVTFTDPYPDAVTLWTGTGMDGIVPEGSHGELSEEKGVAGVMGTDLTRAPIGTGPFKFVEWVSGSHITLERFDDYWADGVPAPGIDQVVFEIMPDDAAKLAALVAGSVHIVDKVPFRDFETVGSMPGIVTERMPGIQTQILYINLGAPPFGIGPDEAGDEAAIEKALNARKFLYHAVDRDQILDRLFYGMGTIQLGPWFPDSDWTSPELKEMPTYDPALAQEYLDKSYPDGFSFRMMCTNAQWFCDVSTIIQEQLRPYGVEVEVIPIDKSAFFDTMYETFDWEVGMEDWGQEVPLALDWLFWGYYRNNHNHNHWHHAAEDLPDHYHVTVPGHEEFCDLYDIASVEPDEQTRKELVWEMEEMVTLDVIQADLMWLDNLYAWRDSVVGYGNGVTPAGDINLNYVTEFTP